MDHNLPISHEFGAHTAAAFDRNSGSILERALFNHRRVIVVICALLTIFLGFSATRLTINASFEKTIPTHQAYILNYFKYQHELQDVSNAIRIVVETPAGSIYDAAYLTKLKALNDAVFLVPGVDRDNMQSLWTGGTRWIAVTKDGLQGGPVIPDQFTGTPSQISDMHINVGRSGQLGRLVALDGKSSVIYVPLLDRYENGAPLDYGRLAEQIDQLRKNFEAQGLSIHVTGFAMIVGALIGGMRSILMFFAFSIFVATCVLYTYTRCVRSTLFVVVSSLIAVTWQLGLLRLLGFSLNPYSILVPFLVFAIGMSHGAQKMNGIMQDVGRGIDKLIAARYTFRRLFIAGLTALLADAVGFAVLMVIDIQAIRELALAASLGVGALIFTNLILLPIMLSFFGVSPRAATRSLRDEQAKQKKPLWVFLDLFTRRRFAAVTVCVAAVLAVGAFALSTKLQIGDLDPGAPELRAHSLYNQDVAYENQHYRSSGDLFAIMVATPQNGCADYDVLNKVNDLQWRLRHTPGVASTDSLPQMIAQMFVGLNQGNPKWYGLVQNQRTINYIVSTGPSRLFNLSCSLLTVYTYLDDHRAATLTGVVDQVNQFAAANNGPNAQFLLAAGSAGIQAATNIVVAQAWWEMLFMVYCAVIILCFIAFRSWRAVVVAVLPLMLTSILAEALMVVLNMGVKVATLPVIALGVGIGIDYALYIVSVMLRRLRAGESLSDAYYGSLVFTGKVVILTGLTLAVCVVTWVLSPIKYQADMGLLLAFMFVWNMFGATILLPALAHFFLKPQIVKPTTLSSSAPQPAKQSTPYALTSSK
jgi:predicted RND superfamily exporter protein